MKLLESTRFEAINNALSITTGDSTISGRIESYSCKLAGGDKAMYKRFSTEQGSRELQALSPPQTQLGMSPGQGHYSNLNSAIAELQWTELSKTHLNFDLKIIPDISESLLFYNIICKKVVCVQNIKQCLEHNMSPKCQHLTLTCPIKDCISRFTWLASNNAFYCENVQIMDIYAVHSFGNSVLLLHVTSNRVELLLFDVKSKVIVHKHYVTDVNKVRFGKIVLKDLKDVETRCEGFLLLNGECYKISSKDNKIFLHNHHNFSDIIDVMFTTDGYFLLTEHSNLYHCKDDKFTKIITAVEWKTYCLISDNSFLVSDYKSLYLCGVDEDHKMKYFQMPLQLVTSIVFYKDLHIAVCVTSQNRFFRIKTDQIDFKEIKGKTLILDINNINSTVRLSREIQSYTDRIDEVSKSIEKQNAIIKDLAIITRSNLLTNYFNHEFKIEEIRQFTHAKYFKSLNLKIHPDICPLLSESDKSWFYKTRYLDNRYELVHDLYQIPKDKNTIQIRSECSSCCKSYNLNSSIQKILADGSQKIGVRITLGNDTVNTENMLSAQPEDNSVSSDDLYDSINKLALYSRLPMDMYKITTNLKTYLNCSQMITDRSINSLFSEFCDNPSGVNGRELRLNINGDTVEIKINEEENRIEMSSNKSSTLNQFKKHLVKKSQPDNLYYNAQDRLRIENALRLLKTEILNPEITWELLHEVKQRIRRISSQFIHV